MDVVVGIVLYGYAKDQGWIGSTKSSNSGKSNLELGDAPPAGRDVILVQGDGNFIDTSAGHNDSHNAPETPAVTPAAEGAAQ